MPRKRRPAVEISPVAMGQEKTFAAQVLAPFLNALVRVPETALRPVLATVLFVAASKLASIAIPPN